MKNYYVKANWKQRKDLTTEEIKNLWHKMERENIEKIVFYDSYMNLKNFKKFVNQENNYFAVIYFQKEIKAFFWLNNFIGKTAMLHFSFFKNSLPEKYNIGERVLNWCFQGGYEHLYSLTPAIYWPTIKFAKNLKAEYLGELKKACYLIRGDIYVNGSILSFKKNKE